jgi:hypothetical protein
MNKPLIFEGAGWDKTESATDIGNCRIRTRIKNNNGEIIYLEMMGREKSKYGKHEKDWPDFVGFVSHCFVGEDCNLPSKYRKLELGTRISWDAKTLLEWVNFNLNCSFTSLDVQNNGVRVHDTKAPLCESVSDLVFES